MNLKRLGGMKRMSDNQGILQKMDAMNRRALASLEAMQKAIADGDRGQIGKHMIDAENALSYLKDDLKLHDTLAKSENAVVMGVSRVGRSTAHYTEHRVV